MLAIRLSLLRPDLDRETQRSVPSGNEVTDAASLVGQLGVRDHRDDGSAIGGLLAGLTLSILVWALFIGLLIVLL